MSVLDRVSDGITKHSRIVIVVLLVTTVAIGSGASMVEQTSSLSEFQSGTSEAAQAQEYITENFSGGSDNTTSAQVIVRSDNVLSKESLLRQLRLQRAIRTNGTVNGTLANDSQTVGIANIIASAAVRMDRAEELKARGEKLKQKGEKLKERAERLKERVAALNESKAKLEERAQKLKRKGKRLEQRGNQLKERAKQLNESRQELKQRGKRLQQRAQELKQDKKALKQNATDLKERAQKLNKSRQELKQRGQELKRQARKLNKSRQRLKRDAAALKERARELKESRRQLKQDARNLSQRAEALKQSKQQLRQRAASLKKRAQELNQTRRELRQRKQKLEQRAQELKQDKRELRQDAAALKERAQKLNESRQELRQRKQELEQRAQSINETRKSLEQRAQSINETRKSLEQRAKELKRRAKELAEDRLSGTVPPKELRQRKRQLEQDRSDLANDTAVLKRRVEELKEDKAALTRNATALKERAQKLNESRQELKQRKQALRKRAQELKQDKQELQQDAAALEERAQKLEEKLEPIQQRKQELKQKGKQLKQDKQELQQRKQELKRKGKQLKQDKQELQQRKRQLKQRAEDLKAEKAQLERQAQQLKQKGKQLKEDKQELQQRKRQLKQRAKELKEDKKALDQRAQKLKQKGKQLKQDSQELEQQAEKLEEKQAALKNDSQALKERGQELQNDSEALKAAKNELEQKTEELEEDRKKLQNGGQNLTLTEKIRVIESRNQSEIDTVIEVVLAEKKDGQQSRKGVFVFMPTDYEPGSTTANATMIVVTQSASTSTGGGTASDRIVESQLAIQDIVTERYGAEDAYVFGAGIISDEISRSMTDSLIIVGPLALLFVLLVLIIAYRDLIDIALGLFGIVLVLVWTFGFMGWAGIAFSQIFIAVPVLLIGLSIDYAIHVIMRHREEHGNGNGGIRGSMNTTLGGIAVALVLVTLTAVIGFLSNLTSSVPPIRDFGIVSSVGITAALLVFGALVPALKVEIDTFLEGRGWDRNKRAFGTGGGTLGSLLSGGATAARRAPRVVIVIALLLTVAGGIGASQVDTSFSQEDFLADEPPQWMESLPEPFNPGKYTAKSSLDYVNEHFLRQDSNAQILIRGNITEPGTLTAIEHAEQNASEQSVSVVLSGGETDIKSPLSVMERVAAQNETFNQTYVESDTDGDGIPDTNLEQVYDTLFEVAPDKAASVIYRNDNGNYEAMKMSISIEGDASGSAVTEQMSAVAASIEESSKSDVQAIATGRPIVFKQVQDQILRTVIVSLLVTLVVTFVFLMIVYRLLHGNAILGFVTLLPVGFSVAWILGTMYLLGIPFNVITGLITSLTVGLGIAYSIHLSERYTLELESKNAWDALRTAVTGTGGALLGSAATTVGGFGVLAFAILPPLRQFGIITGLTIIYAFLASVFVLPSLLIIWTRWFGPDDAFRSTWGGFESPVREETASTDDD
jgi:hydrophobe/amphiphile efflux-3 (HAE3) family protein